MSSKPDSLYSKESEMMVLGCTLSHSHALKIAATRLDTMDFYFNEHRLIYQALKKLYNEQKPGEVYLTAEELRRQDQLQAIGGIAYLAGLAQFAGTSANIQEYIDILKAKSFNRLACHFLEEGKKAFLSDPTHPNEVIETVRHKLTDLGKRYGKSDKASIGEILSGTTSKIDPIPLIERIEERQQYYKRHRKPFMMGIPTGFAELDQEATILEETNLVVIAARPSMGKTAFAINIANHICIDRNKPVAIFSLEMGADQLVERFLSLRTQIPGEKIKRGELTDAEFARLQEEDRTLRRAPLFIEDHNCSSVSQVISKARRLKEEENISLFIIDYLQLLSIGGNAESRQYEIAEISRKLKLLAMELKAPLICISQLSRKVEERRDHRPVMSDLRDSGQIEQDSDVVMFIQRREYYDPLDTPGLAELIVAKNRNGSSIPSCYLHFDGKCGRFSNLEKEPVVHKPKPMRHLRSERFSKESSHPLLR